MDINILVKQLKPGQKLEIKPDGSITKVWNDFGRNKKHKLGNLFVNITEIIPLTNKKLWPEIHQPGLINWNKFGKELPKRETKDYQMKLLVSIIESFIDLKNGKFDTITLNSHTYKVYSINGIKAYYSEKSNILRIIEHGKNKYYIPQISQSSKVEYLAKNAIIE